MSVAAKLSAFAVVLVLCFAAAFGVGAAVGPIDDAPADPGHSVSTTEPGTSPASHGGAPVDPAVDPGDGTGQHGTGHGG